MQASGLTAWDLSCRKGDRLLFGSLDLRLEQGEALHLVGPNGVGKTSLIRMLAGLLRPTRSELASPGSPERGIVHWQGSVGMVDERPALDEGAPLEGALAFWSSLDDGSAARLDELGLGDLPDVPVRYLSTGQRKRAAFARLLAQGADNWLLDEPLNGLDPAGVALVEELISAQRADGGVVVLASHQPIRLEGAQVIDLRDYPG